MTNQTMILQSNAMPAERRLLARLCATRADWAVPALRLSLAVVMFPHGAQKALGWFGGYGWSGTMGYLTGSIGLPAPLAALLILTELLAPVALLLGLLTRPAALGIAAIMAGAIATVHAQHGFFMNWFGDQKGEGFEYHLLVIGMALALLVRGGGSASLDRRLSA
jgi:putative oxidoreductase